MRGSSVNRIKACAENPAWYEPFNIGSYPNSFRGVTIRVPTEVYKSIEEHANRMNYDVGFGAALLLQEYRTREQEQAKC